MDLQTVFEKVALALGLGLLVGMQRERVQSRIAGIRTFALITVMGAVCALLGNDFGGWIVAIGGLAIALLMAIAYFLQPESADAEPGLTTEVAAILMFFVGAYLVVGYASVAFALGGGIALLLHWKQPMHTFVARIGEKDLRAIMQFVLIALVILPIVPNEAYGPYKVLNPYKIWFMVVLIVGISLSGYIVQKWLGSQSGAIIGAALGGLISSTATTVSYSRRAEQEGTSIRVVAAILMIATAIAGVRVLVEVAVVAPGSLPALGPPLGVFSGLLVGIAATMFWVARGKKLEASEHGNPAELKSALIFGGLYAGVIFAVAAAKDWLGDRGVYVVAVLSGLHDLDAITLSTAQLVDEEQMAANTGWRVILIASMSNLVVKAIIAGSLGNRRLFAWIGALFGIAMVGGILLLLLWPAAFADVIVNASK
jgi:uncharacterized membrane protein (DUF4010 family)